MKILLTAFTSAVTTLLLSGAVFAAPPCGGNFCKNGGNQCSLNGATHTCGTCMNGTTTVLYVGALSSADADAACACQHDKTAPCTSAGKEVIANQPKTPRTVKAVKALAPQKTVAPR
jgi:hypothetical protein